MRANSTQRLSVEMGLAGVLSTQLWHHTFIDESLADSSASSHNKIAHDLKQAAGLSLVE
jgi:hypothetical protein